MRRLAATLLCLLAFGAAHAGEAEDDVAALRAEAKTEAAAGHADAARAKLLLALGVRPASPEVLADLVELAGADADEREVWAMRYAAVAADAKGAVKIAKLASPRGIALAKARADAVAALLKSMDKLKGVADAELVRHLAKLLRLIAGRNAALRDLTEPRIAEAVARTQASPDEVIARLRAAIPKAMKAGQTDLAFLGARALRGLGVQRRREAGGMTKDALEDEGLAVMEAVRKIRWEKSKPLSCDDLRAVRPEDRRAFEMKHATWDAPILAVSPAGLYRLESVAGARSTLMTAVDCEAVHRRLAKFAGRDPFAGRPGTLRLTRSVPDMEGEGQSLLWAQAFNAGEVTYLPAGRTSRRWKARGCSHELMHRFDSELYGWLPGWLREGRANYTQVTSTWHGAPELDARAVDFAMLDRARGGGYGDPARLGKLLDADATSPHQDDYDVGYSLWLYLSRYRADWYAPRIEAYLASQRPHGTNDCRALFVQHMADGKDGRPASLDAVARDFQTFLDEAASTKGWAAEWRAASAAAEQEAERLRNATPAPGAKEMEGPGDEDIFDASNHLPLRARSAIPPFGEFHAFTAGTFLEAAGDAEGATLAYAWARRVDEPEREALARAAGFHQSRGNATAAWLLRAEASALNGPEAGPAPPAPEKLREILEPLNKALLREADACLAARLVRSVNEILAESTHLARLLAPRHSGPPQDLVEPAEFLVPAGVAPGTWAPVDPYAGVPPRAPWCVRRSIDVVLGRNAPGPRDGPADAAATPQSVFVETARAFDGGWTLRTRLRPLAPGTRAAIVVGKTTADRGLAVRFSFDAWGSGGFKKVMVEFDDQRASDWGVAAMQASADVKPAASVEVALQVRGSYLCVEIAGKPVASFGTATGLPIVGRIGFQLTAGAAELLDARVETVVAKRATLDLRSPPDVPPEAWDGRAVEGVPADPLGRFVVALPGGTTEECAAASIAVTKPAQSLLGSPDLHSRVFVIAPVVDGGQTPAAPAGAPWWLAVDADGIVRAHGRLVHDDPSLPRARTLFHRLRGW